MSKLNENVFLGPAFAHTASKSRVKEWSEVIIMKVISPLSPVKYWVYYLYEKYIVFILQVQVVYFYTITK